MERLNNIRNFIVNKYPNYDFDRYRFKFGDMFEFKYGILIALESSLSSCKFYVIKRGFGFKEFTEVTIQYSELPYYKKGKFTSLNYKLSNICDIGKFVNTKEGVCLVTEHRNQYFIGLCLNMDSYYYKSKILICKEMVGI